MTAVTEQSYHKYIGNEKTVKKYSKLYNTAVTQLTSPYIKVG